ncbi:hypothetical protein FEM48_ZijujUnG0063500 [Ziziphus jujuba var. spinosa]|uniref:GTD-binding domain-containing protein n=1 Tax=Ziziphus jujuba var. spinosa TaxID=714518 RepID=A0A978U8X9_ZIZJJ|nr:hypothetical protein FEM48_ZijujUnG0063500 [Ziziphus jujuba var. spinosa]
MSDVGYKELKINSGSETEVPWSDHDNGRSNDRESREPVEDFIDKCASENMAKESSTNSSTEKPTNCSYIPGPFLSDLTLPYDISKAYDVKSLASHVSFDDYDGPGGDAHGDEVQIIDFSNSNEIQMLRKSVSVESCLESVNGSNVTEIEERIASEIATNQAMAMITRLKEEKAALHMEALLYLRMMEEQAEYDVEALERANDLLTEKQKETQDMKVELELYTLNFSDEKKRKIFMESLKMKITLYISQRLRCLEKKLCQISRNGTFCNMPNRDHSKKFADDGHNGTGSHRKEILLNGQIEEY